MKRHANEATVDSCYRRERPRLPTDACLLAETTRIMQRLFLALTPHLYIVLPTPPLPALVMFYKLRPSLNISQITCIPRSPRIPSHNSPLALHLRSTSTKSTMPPSFLLIGIAWDQYEAMVGAEKAPEMISRVRAALARDEQSFKDIGLEYQYLDYAPGESMQRLEKVLQEEEFSGVCV